MTNVDPQFLAFLEQEEARAYDGTLLEEVEAAIKSYNGAEYGDEEDGRSQVVARDVAETVDYMLTSIMDVMVSSGRIVEFEPPSEEDEDQADDATEAMHYMYRTKSGYRFIHDWAKAGLLEKIGVIKTCVERKKKRVEGLMPTELMPQSQEEAQQAGIIEASPQGDDGFGNPTHFHVATLTETAAQFNDYNIPLEEFLRAPDARDLETAVYLCHLTEKSLSDLVQMGFSWDQVKNLGESQNPQYLALSNARDDGRSNWLGVLDRTGPNRKVWLREEYVLYDLDGDGIAERLCIHRVGADILNVETVDYQPFEYWCPYPMQGRFIGQSLADKSMDIQRVNTVLERNALDSLYQQTSPGTFVHEDSIGDHTLDDLLTIRPGRVVRWAGSVEPKPEQRNDVSEIAFAAIEFKTKQRESRTGITRLNKGVDEDTLNDTAKGQAMLMSRGQQMERYVIRNFAEGVARLFIKKVGLMRKHGEPFQIRVDGEYRTVDPSQWPEGFEANVVVGLGSGSKQDRLMYRQMVAQTHSMLKMAQSPIVTDENIYNNLAAAAKDAGLAPNDIYTRPPPPPTDQNGNVIPPQPQPDPKVMALQAEMQVKQQQVQQQAQDNEAKLQIMAQKHASEAMIAQARMQMEADLELRQQNLQAWLDQQQMKIDAAKHQAEQETKVKISKMRPGGKLDK